MHHPPFRPPFTDTRTLLPLQHLHHSLYRPNPHMSLALPDSPTQGESPASPNPPNPDLTQDSVSSDKSADKQSKQEPPPGHLCQWIDCEKVLPDPESLYNHLCNDHIGRKSTGNLCLTCKWKDCGTSCAKRDHITSHLRGTSHIPQYSHSVFSSPRLDPVPF